MSVKLTVTAAAAVWARRLPTRTLRNVHALIAVITRPHNFPTDYGSPELNNLNSAAFGVSKKWSAALHLKNTPNAALFKV